MLLPVLIHAQEKAIIEGQLTDKNGVSISFGTVYVVKQGAGTFADEDGRFRLEIQAGEGILVEASHTGFKKMMETIDIAPGEKRIINFRLNFTEISAVEITDSRTRRTTLSPVPLKDIHINPSVQQGIESILTTQLGVQMSNELSSSYSVRGGSFAENLVYVNDIEVYRPFLARSGEQEGLSFPNPDMVGSIYFSAGGFDARYGDRMSSVLDIQYKRPRRFGGSFMASLLGGSLSIESASKNERLRQVTGVRYLSNQYLLGSLDTQGDYQPTFLDVQSYWTYDLTDKWEISFLGNYASNDYRFFPTTRQTQFGSFNEALRFTVFFDGQESTSFETFFGAVSTDYRPDNNTRLKFTASAFRSLESETFDILGQYRLDELERDLGGDEFGDVARNRGIGSFLDHARNELDATVFSLQHRGYKTIDNKYLQWGVVWNAENIGDKLSEWSFIDSAGFSVPINPRNAIVLQDVIKGNNTLISNRLMGYVQNSWDLITPKDEQITATLGIRANYWDFNGETVVSPRGTIAYQPKWQKQINDSTMRQRDIVFRFSSGIYYQPAFYRELRSIDGTINPNNTAQRSIHFVLGADINFKMWNRPFKYVAEAYYKKLDNLVPFVIDNIRLRYYGDEVSSGYATGLDMKINGEFIPGIESWANLSFMSTREDIEGDFYNELINSDGERIIPGFTQNNIAVDTNTVFPGSVPRPNDRLIFFSMFFQDQMPSFPTFRVHLNVLFGTGLPFGPPNSPRYAQTERYAPYRRVDIGFSKDLTPKIPGKGFFGKFNTALISLEVWNLLDINNTISYTWITESGGRQYGVPNFLTSRRLNLKLVVTF